MAQLLQAIQVVAVNPVAVQNQAEKQNKTLQEWRLKAHLMFMMDKLTFLQK